MRWLITGGCGFIGSALVARLVAEGGHAIRVLDNLAAGSPRRIAAVAACRETSPSDVGLMADATAAAGVELVVGDVRDMALCLRAAEGAEIVVHLAGPAGAAASLMEPRFDCETVVAGTLNMLEAARHVDAARFVFASANDAHGEYRPGANGRDDPAPASPHGAAKLAGEAYCSAYARSFGVATVALRLGNVYGPGDEHGVIGRLLRAARRGERIEIHGDGRQIRDFLHIDDTVEAMRLAAGGGIEAGAICQVSGGEETSIAEAVDLLRKLARHVGWPAAQIVHGPARAGCLGHGHPGAAAMPALPGWQPRIDFATGLARTVRWIADQPDRGAIAA